MTPSGANQLEHDIEQNQRIKNADFNRKTNELHIEASSDITFDIIADVLKNAIDHWLVLSEEEFISSREHRFEFTEYGEL